MPEFFSMPRLFAATSSNISLQGKGIDHSAWFTYVCVRKLLSFLRPFEFFSLKPLTLLSVVSHALPLSNGIRDFKIQQRGRRQIYQSRVWPVSRTPCSWREILS